MGSLVKLRCVLAAAVLGLSALGAARPVALAGHVDTAGAGDADMTSRGREWANAAVRRRLQSSKDETNGSRKKTVAGRAPSCNGCARRESVLAKNMRLAEFQDHLSTWYGKLFLLLGTGMVIMGLRAVSSRETMTTLTYSALYLISSPTAILVNKILMKDYGFGYPVMVSAFGQLTTAVCAVLCVRFGGVSVETGARVPARNMILLGGASALALTLGQYPYLFLTVAFIQMLKAFSPAYMVIFLYLMGVETPSRNVVLCVLGLSLCTCIASAGEVNFSIVGVLFMAGASCSDAIRLVVAQKLLTNNKMNPLETLYYTAPVCLLWMIPAAFVTEVPAALRHNSFALMRLHPMMFLASGFSGFFVNITSFLLVKRTSSMTLKTMTMARNGGLVIVSAILMGETITLLEGVGYSGLLMCFALYTGVKSREAAEKQKAALAAMESEAPLIRDVESRSKGEAVGEDTDSDDNSAVKR